MLEKILFTVIVPNRSDRSVARSMIPPALAAGISVASVEYRTIKDAIADGLVPPNLGQEEKDLTHTANFGIKLKEHCDTNHVTCDLVYPGA